MADKIKAAALIEDFLLPLAEKWGYIWGKSGQVWTRASQDAATRDMTVRYGAKWIGRKVADCSGLFVWAYKLHGLKIFHGSNTIYNKYSTDIKGAVADGILIRPGAAVYQVSDGKRTHIGLYVGGGKCIEAKGTRSGVVESDISGWDEWAELADVDYEGMPWERMTVALKTLRKGDKGTQVTQLQELLNADPRYPTKVDGIFGGDTLSSVRAYQHDHGLTPDGIVGPLTWSALRAVEDDEPEGAKPEDPSEDSSPLTVEDRLERLEEAVFGQEGGDADGS